MTLFDNKIEELGDKICLKCEEILENHGALQLRDCGHRIHLLCFMKYNLFRKGTECPYCKKKTNGFLAEENFPGQMFIDETNLRYILRYNYCLDGVAAGYAIMMCFCDSRFDAEIYERTLIKFQITGTSHSLYIHYPQPNNPTIITKTERKCLPLNIRVLQRTYSVDLGIMSKEVLKLETDFLIVEYMKVIIVKVLLVGGMKSKDMRGIWQMQEIVQSLPFRELQRSIIKKTKKTNSVNK